MDEIQTKSFGPKPLGYAFTLLGGFLWAVGGACGQSIFGRFPLSTDWLVPVRLIISGLLLLLFSLWKYDKSEVFRVFRTKKDAKDLLLFSLFGAGASQYTYYMCIQHSNAAFATVISYVFPVLILLYTMMKTRRGPKLYELVAVLLVTAGAFICTTHLELGALSVSGMALFFGLLSALASAYHTIKPQRLLRSYPLPAIMGISMLIGGLVMSLLCRPWRFAVPASGDLLLLMSVIIIGGTIFAFTLFQAGVRIVGSLAGGILASIEPLGAVVLAALFLGVAFTSEDVMGFVLILSTIPIIALGQSRDERMLLELADSLLPKQDEAESSPK